MGKQSLETSLVFVADTHALVFALTKSPALRDLHDRAIVSTALELGSPLITRDKKLKNIKEVKVIW